jgi:hypothetical protein
MICEKNSENPAQSMVKKSRIPLCSCGIFTNCGMVFLGFFQRFCAEKQRIPQSPCKNFASLRPAKTSRLFLYQFG